MSEFKGTKGKWKYYNNQGTMTVSDMYGAGVVIQSKSSVSSPYHAKANAKLIACAPEMLEMLEQSLYRLENTNNVAFCNAIRKLISKATTL